MDFVQGKKRLVDDPSNNSAPQIYAVVDLFSSIKQHPEKPSSPCIEMCVGMYVVCLSVCVRVRRWRRRLIWITLSTSSCVRHVAAD